MVLSNTVLADSIYQNRIGNNLSLKILGSATVVKLNQLNLNNLVKYKYMLMNQKNPTLLRQALKKYNEEKSIEKGTKNLKTFMKFNKMRNKRKN